MVGQPERNTRVSTQQGVRVFASAPDIAEAASQTRLSRLARVALAHGLAALAHDDLRRAEPVGYLVVLDRRCGTFIWTSLVPCADLDPDQGESTAPAESVQPSADGTEAGPG